MTLLISIGHHRFLQSLEFRHVCLEKSMTAQLERCDSPMAAASEVSPRAAEKVRAVSTNSHRKCECQWGPAHGEDRPSGMQAFGPAANGVGSCSMTGEGDELRHASHPHVGLASPMSLLGGAVVGFDGRCNWVACEGRNGRRGGVACASHSAATSLHALLLHRLSPGGGIRASSASTTALSEG